MFKSRTVFIVGAGASVEAGLPTNEELKLKIAELLDIRSKEFGSTQISGSRDIVASMREKVKMEGKTDIRQYVHSALQIRDALPRLAISSAIYTTLNLDKRLGASKGNIKIGLDNIRCVEFFQQYFRSLSATANELA